MESCSSFNTGTRCGTGDKKNIYFEITLCRHCTVDTDQNGPQLINIVSDIPDVSAYTTEMGGWEMSFKRLGTTPTTSKVGGPKESPPPFVSDGGSVWSVDSFCTGKGPDSTVRTRLNNGPERTSRD